MIAGLVAHAGVEFRTGIRDRTLLSMTYLFPLGFYGFMGVFMTEMNPDFITVLIPGLTVFATLAAAMFGLPAPLISARETGVLRSYRIHGVPTPAVFAVPVLTAVAHLLVVGLLIATTAPVLFGAPSVARPAAFAGVLVLIAATHASLGALIGVVSANSRVSVLWSQLVFLPSVLLAGLLVPPEQIPETFQRLSSLLPATYAMDAFRALTPGQEPLLPPGIAITVLAVGAATALVLTWACYAWDDQGAGRRLRPAAGFLAIAPYALAGVLAPW